MKKIILLLSILCVCLGVKAQDITTNSIKFSQVDNSKEIFSFRVTGDTSILHPHDTAYYTMSNTIYREKNYRFKQQNKPMELCIRECYEQNMWVFFSFQIIQLTKPKTNQ